MPGPLPSAPPQREPADTEALPPLHVLWEQTRAPWADTAEIDRLLRGLSQPLKLGEEARDRADVLHRLLEDERLGAARGSDGRRVDGAVAQALMALGHPYALELSPEGLDALRAAEAEARSFIIYDDAPAKKAVPSKAPLPPVVLTPRQEWGKALSVGVGLIEALLVLVGAPVLMKLVGLIVVVVTSFIPAPVAVSPEGLHHRAVHYFCLVLTGLPSLLWMGVASFAFVIRDRGHLLVDIFLLFALAMVVARLALPLCLYGRRPDPEPSSSLAE